MTTDQINSDTLISIGAYLKQLREEKNLNLEAVFSNTRVPLTKLRLIEDDAFDELGDAVFVQGYIRSYAKFLGVDADPLVEQYHAANRLSDIVSEELVGADEAHETDQPEKLAPFNLENIKPSYIIAGIALVFVIVTFIVFSGEDEPTDVNVVSASTVDERESIGNTNSDVGLAKETDMSVSPLREGEQVEESLPAPEVKPTETQAQLAVAQGQTMATAPTNEALESKTTSQSVNSQPKTADTLLEISFIDECWVEVRDVNDNVVFADIQNSGDNLRLFGQAPFNIMFGNVHAVAALAINAQPVDVQPRGTKKTLRLQVAGAN